MKFYRGILKMAVINGSADTVRTPLPQTIQIRSFSEEQTLRKHAKENLIEYQPPKWAASLQNIPKYKLQLSMTNTPIQKWKLPGVPKGIEVFIKRDDLTGSSLSGNKARKLDFLLAEALLDDCDTLIGCGSIQSNFCRAFSCAGRELGFSSHLLLRSSSRDTSVTTTLGNVMMNRLVGAHIYLMPKKSQYIRDFLPRLKQLSESLRFTGKKPYLTPIGGSSVTGLFGHLECFDEMIKQGILNEFSDIVIASGSGGSTAALGVGNHLNGSKLKIHGMAVCDDAAYFHGEINEMLKGIGLQDSKGSGVKSEDLVEIVEGVKGLGYGLSTDEELDFIIQTAATTGIFLDPVYSGKAAFHMVQRLNHSPQCYKGKKILFYHSGSVLGLFDGRLNEILRNRDVSNRVHDWTELQDKPPDDQCL